MPPPGQTAPPPKWPAQYKIPIVVQQRLDALLDPLLNPDGEHSDDPYGDAVKAAVAAFMETPQGKKLKDLILSRRVLPMTIMVVGTALLGMAASNADIPSTPELGDGVTVKVEFSGKFDDPKGVFITLGIPLGSGPKEKRRPKPVGTTLPADLHTKIASRIDIGLLRKWIVKQAAWELETAGPDEEEKKRRLYHYVKDPSGDVTPDTQLVAEALARKIVDAGKQGQKRVDFDLEYERIWDQLYDLRGLTERLQSLVGTLAEIMPHETAGIEAINFRCGNRRIPILLQRTSR